MEAVDDMWDELTSTGTVTMERRAALRLATTHAIRLAAQIVESRLQRQPARPRPSKAT